MHTPDADSVQRVSTGGLWERQVGFCRVLRAGELVFTAGTVAADERGEIHGADCYEQCRYIFAKLDAALAQVNASLSDVVRVVCYITRLEDTDGFTRAHREVLGDVLPVCTCVQVAGLLGGALAEIELTALVRRAA